MKSQIKELASFLGVIAIATLFAYVAVGCI